MKLTDTQSQAVTSASPFIAVAAGAGSGKTRVLVRRIQRMIADGVDPKRIAVITFTNNAAREIETRLTCETCEGALQIESGVEGHGQKEMMTCPDCMGVPAPVLGYAGTVHGLILRVVRMCHDLIGFPADVSVMDEEQTDELLQTVSKELKIKATMKEMREALSQGPEKLLGGKFPTGANGVAAEYYQRCRRAGLLDFDSLLRFGSMALSAADEAGFVLPWCNYLWDEFQDSGDDDWKIMHRLPSQTMFVVGDPDQSIYGFRGAKPALFNSLLTGSSGFEVIRMEDNFRCALGVCMSANQLIDNQTDRFQKSTISRTGKTGRVRQILCDNEAAEAEAIATLIREIGPGAEKDAAILVRTNALADRFANVMKSFGFAVRQRTHRDLPTDWKTARALLALLASPNNDLLAYWWIKRVSGKPMADEIKLRALRTSRTINAAGIGLPRSATIEQAIEILGQNGITPVCLDKVKAARATLAPDAGLAELAHEFGRWEEGDEGEGLTISTIHAAKGREWSSVFLPAFEQGTIPSGSKSASIDEERRLAYVGFTRAKDNLVLTVCQKRVPSWGSRKPEPVSPSQFICETWVEGRAGHHCEVARFGE